jgi:ABC-2 type transport system ATP-binding protein
MTVEAQDLIKRYGRHFELRVPSLRIRSGETLGLVGNNGAGKTTFLRLLLDLIYADDGRVRVDGREIAGRHAWKIDVGSYLDESFLLDFLTADESFDFTGATYGLSRGDVRAALAPYRGFFTDPVLGERTRYVGDLSAGNRKKVGLIAALFVQPKLLILDEPFANLDPGSQGRLLKILRQQNARRGTTMIISSHDIGHVTELCSRITVLEEGRIVRDIETSDETLGELRGYFDRNGAGPA